MAFSTTNAVVLTATIVAVGKYSNDEDLTVRLAVGATGVAIGLAAINEINPQLASRFASLILLVAAFTYVPAIVYHAGLTDTPPPKWGRENTTVRKLRKRPGKAWA